MVYKEKRVQFYSKENNMLLNMSLLRSSKTHCRLNIFYQHAMPNGIFNVFNAVRHDISVAYN